MFYADTLPEGGTSGWLKPPCLFIQDIDKRIQQIVNNNGTEDIVDLLVGHTLLLLPAAPHRCVAASSSREAY